MEIEKVDTIKFEFFGDIKPGTLIMDITGKPYITVENILDNNGNLLANAVTTEDGKFAKFNSQAKVIPCYNTKIMVYL